MRIGPGSDNVGRPNRATLWTIRVVRRTRANGRWVRGDVTGATAASTRYSCAGVGEVEVIESPDDDPAQIDSRTALARALTNLRERAGLTVRQVAVATGISLSTLSGYYSGRHVPQVRPPNVLRDILRACGVTEEVVVAQWTQALVRVRRRPGRPAAGTPSPYRGLACYEPEHADWFFGREAVVDAVLSRLAQRCSRGGPLLVVGPSGSGKSSVLRAGVIPALRRGVLPVTGSGDWRLVLMTPGVHPCRELADQFTDVVDVAVDDIADLLCRYPEEAADALRVALKSTQDGADRPGLVLVVDQFEELFTTCDDESERLAFVNALCVLAESAGEHPSTILVVLGMRADFYPHASAYARLVPVLQDGQVVVGPMTEPELRRAIVGPAGRAGLDMESGLVEVLLRDLAPSTSAGSTTVHDAGALPMLSHALLVTWERRERGVLTVDSYHDSGGIQRAVSATAEAVYASLDEADQDLARMVFLRLVHMDDHTADTRRRVPFDELRIGRADAAIAEVVGQFVAHRLLTAGANGVEIAHETLIAAWPRLRDWLDADRAGLRVHRRLTAAANAWLATGRDPNTLYRGTLLDNAQAWGRDPVHARDRNETESEFLDASVQRRITEQRMGRRRVRRRLGLVAVVVVLALVASVLTGYVIAQGRAADRERDLAQSVQLAEQADRFRASDVSLSMQLALAAYRISPTPQARASLLDSVAGPAGTRLLGPDEVLQAVAVASGGRLLATGGTSGQVQLWDLTNRRRPKRAGRALIGGTDTVYTVAFSPDGRTLAVGGADRVVRLWNVADPAHPRQLGEPLTGPTNTVYSVAFSPNGQVLAAGSADDTIHLWDMANPARPTPFARPLTGFSSYVQSLVFSPDGRLLAAGSADHAVRLWSLADSAQPVPLGGPLTGATAKVFAVAFSPDGRTLAEGGADRSVHLWDVSTGTPTAIGAPLTGATGWINAVAFSADGHTLAVGGSDSVVRLWNVSAARVIETLPHPGPVTALVFFDGDRTLATSAADGVVRLWSIPGPVIDNRADTVFSLSYAASGTLLAVSSGSRPNTVELWDTRDVWRPTSAGPAITSPAGVFDGSLGLSPDGRVLAIGCSDGSIQLWDIADRARPVLLGRPVPASTALIESLTFSPDGHVLATAGDDRTVRLWDVRRPDRPVPIATLTGPTNYVYGVAFSADARVLAAGSADDRTWLWDITTPANPKRLPALTGFSNYVYSVAFSPHGRVLAVGSADKTVRLWDLTDASRPASLGPPLTGATNYVYSAVFSPDGHTLAVGSTDHTVLLWNVARPRQPDLLASLTAPADSVFVVVFSPDGHTIAAGTAEKAVRLWTVDPVSAAAEVCAVAGDPITRQEWAQYIPGRPYQPPC